MTGQKEKEVVDEDKIEEERKLKERMKEGKK